jgi:hypothetical protein
MPDPTLAQRIKAKHPGAYDDLSDSELEHKVKLKYPSVYDDLPTSELPPENYVTGVFKKATGIGPAGPFDRPAVPAASNEFFARFPDALSLVTALLSGSNAPQQPPLVSGAMPGPPPLKGLLGLARPLSELAESATAEADVPLRFQRFDAPGKTPSVTKPHGLYVTPEGVTSPHADIGDKTAWIRPRDANVLNVTGSTPLPIRQGAIDSGTGVHALKAIVGETEFQKLATAPIDELDRRLASLGVTTKYFDRQERLEALGAMAARHAGYDGIYMHDPSAPDFTEYVGLTARGLTRANK